MPFRAEADARARREHLEWLAQISPEDARRVRGQLSEEAEAKAQRKLLEWLAEISPEHEVKLHSLLPVEAEARETREHWEWLAEVSTVHEGNWDPSQHPRAPKGQPDGGQWVAKGGASSAGSAATPTSPFRTAAFHAGQSTAQLAAFGGAASPTWPTSGPMPSWLPKVDVRAGTDAAAAAGTLFGVLAGALRNASMGAYWARMPAREATPYIWVWELERRVRAGKLSREDAIGIFNAAVLGAEAQGFKPTGGTMSAVHTSAADFLGKAEAVYFARKKKKLEGWATQPGGYQQSGGRVFPTKRNSGLDGYALRKEQEEFFKRGLSQGTPPEVLRGQAHEAGVERIGRPGQPDQLDDPEVEAALQRAMKEVKNQRRHKK